MRSEQMVDKCGVSESHLRDAGKPGDAMGYR